MSSRSEAMSDAVADRIAACLPECGRRLLSTGLSPDEILVAALATFLKFSPELREAPQAVLDDYADSLAISLCNRMLLEHDLAIVEARRMRPC